jgi:hypothetical protein
VLDDDVADTAVGAAEIVIIDVDAEEAPEVPPVPVAVTVNVYDVPAVNPDTAIVVDVLVAVNPSGELVTV